MKKVLLATLLLTLSTSHAYADVVGSSIKPNYINPKVSGAIPFGSGAPGISINDSFSINIGNGPVKYIRIKHNNAPINGTDLNANIDGTTNAKYLNLKDINPVAGFFTNPTSGQVWYEKRANNTDVYSVRQIANPILPIAPKFGSLVIAQVPGGDSVPAVYFGEWAPRAGTPPQNSTDLNMKNDQRTAWYVGDNPTKNTQNLATATYNLLGINKHSPGQNDFYTGQVTANFSASKIDGAISRGEDKINFANVTITNTDGSFGKDNIKGQFYGNNAEAMAGYVKRTADSIAFGDKKN